MVGIISVGIGNIASVHNMIKKTGNNVELLTKPANINNFSTIILPGVGSYDNGVKRLNDSGWYNCLKENDFIQSGKVNVIGICLGMQLLCEGSEEGSLEGLSLIPGYCKKFNIPEEKRRQFKTPHMGWANVNFTQSKYDFTIPISKDNRFYFVHSYHYTHENDSYIIGKSNYYYDFGSSIGNKNFIGFQFHPEKSHKFGKQLLTEAIK